jgi:hypothetical protein
MFFSFKCLVCDFSQKPLFYINVWIRIWIRTLFGYSNSDLAQTYGFFRIGFHNTGGEDLIFHLKKWWARAIVPVRCRRRGSLPKVPWMCCFVIATYYGYVNANVYQEIPGQYVITLNPGPKFLSPPANDLTPTSTRRFWEHLELM